MIALAAEDLADLRRWAISAAVVVLAHGAVAASVVRWREPVEPTDTPAAIVIDFAPILQGPVTPQTETPPGPEQVMAEATPEQKIERQPIEDTPPEVKPAPDPEVAIEPPKEIQQETETPRTPAPTTSAPQSIPMQTAAIPAAPNLGQLNPNSTAVPTWKRQIVGLLEANLRYPPAAHSRREHGQAWVFFSIDRQGHLVASRLVRSAGAAVLDEEALALLKRVQPFPPPPPELTGNPVDITLPIGFKLK
jgi:protein TonB